MPSLVIFGRLDILPLQPFLKDVKQIRILVGINVDQMFAEAQRKGLLFFGDSANTKGEFMKWFAQDVRESKSIKRSKKGYCNLSKT